MRLVIAMTAGAAVAALPATAAPTRPIVMASRLATMHSVRVTRPPLLRFGAVPVFAAMATVRHAPLPVHALPLVLRSPRYSGFTALLPRLGAAALLVSAGGRDCGAARRQVPIEALPAMPFVADDCAARSVHDAEVLPPTALVAGHNKNALYRRARAPIGDERN